MWHLQRSKSAPAVGAKRGSGLVTGDSGRDHVTPVLRPLHWLPGKQRIDLKVAVLVYNCLHGLSPSGTEPFRLPLLAPGTVCSSTSLQHLRSLSSGHASRLISSPFLIPVRDHVQCSRSDTCHFGHFNRSCYLLTYLPRRICRTAANSSRRWDVNTFGKRTSTLAQSLRHRHG